MGVSWDGLDFTMDTTRGMNRFFVIGLKKARLLPISIIPCGEIERGEHSMKALVVEPSKMYCKILVRLFEQHGFEVETAASGALGLQRHLIDDFDLTCVALHLEDMTGPEFSATLRKQSGSDVRPVIMLTADENLEKREQHLQAGIIEVFRKSRIPELGEFLSTFSSGHARHASEMEGKVLLVEDDETLAQLIARMLESMGLLVECHVRGEDAKEAFSNGEYDIVLTDIMLAGQMSGLGLVRLIRSCNGRKGRVPILVMSSLDDSARIIEVFREGASDFLGKPLVIEELVARTRNLVLNKQLLDAMDGQRERMQQLAMTDQLTGLYNRHYMADIAPKTLSEAKRHDFPVSLIVADVDHFKAVNDTHGHAVGDTILREVAKLLKAECRQGDFAGRFGGEEFVVLLQHCDLDDAMNWADQVREKLERLNPNGLRVTASFGVASTSQVEADFDKLFFVADKGVYQAKESGRNRVMLGAA